MPAVPDVAYFELAPDWIAEVPSPSTEKLDRAHELAIHARAGGGHAWRLGPRSRTLEVLRRQGAHWLDLGVHKDGDRIRAEPFEDIELEIAVLWADLLPAP